MPRATRVTCPALPVLSLVDAQGTRVARAAREDGCANAVPCDMVVVVVGYPYVEFRRGYFGDPDWTVARVVAYALEYSTIPRAYTRGTPTILHEDGRPCRGTVRMTQVRGARLFVRFSGKADAL